MKFLKTSLETIKERGINSELTNSLSLIDKNL